MLNKAHKNTKRNLAKMPAGQSMTDYVSLLSLVVLVVLIGLTAVSVTLQERWLNAAAGNLFQSLAPGSIASSPDL
ncbi:MAG: hypothetical protein HY587_07165 [Candidatus Omnitrophica bacterium]|nr:hypothetical protein [Candidatus Omnitrophota bacterium]